MGSQHELFTSVMGSLNFEAIKDFVSNRPLNVIAFTMLFGVALLYFMIDKVDSPLIKNSFSISGALPITSKHLL
jgi:hypothetical protein